LPAALASAFVLCSCVTPGPHAASAAQAGLEGDAPLGEHDQYVDVDGAFLRVRVQGDADPDHAGAAVPVLFLHGYGSRLEGWRAVQPAVSADRLTISFDQRGFGLSERPEGAYGPQRHADDAVAVLDALGIKKAIVVGHSYGGGVALRVLLRHPERVAGLVLVDTFALSAQVPSSFHVAKTPIVGEAIFGAFFDEMPGEKYLLAFHDAQRFATAAALEEMKRLMARPGSTYSALETVRGMDYEAVEAGYAAAVVDVPRLIVWGEDDRVTPLRQGKQLAAQLDSDIVVIPQCGHMPSWERPRVVIDAIARVAARSSTSSLPAPAPAPVPAPEAVTP
jgi:pimeloyl-ACP methyl ester carboxylesterase